MIHQDLMQQKEVTLGDETWENKLMNLQVHVKVKTL
jgi:hypothetical protein